MSMKTEPRYEQLKWQRILSIARKATGLPQRKPLDYGEGLEASLGHREGAVQITYTNNTRYRPSATLPTDAERAARQQRRDDFIAAIVAALEAEGYLTTVFGDNGSVWVRKVAPPAPPVEPYLFERWDRIAKFELPSYHVRAAGPDGVGSWANPIAALDRLTIVTHAGTFPQQRWRVVSLDRARAESLHDEVGDATAHFAQACRILTAQAALRDLGEHPNEEAPDTEWLALQQQQWREVMDEYNRLYPGPMPEVAVR